MQLSYRSYGDRAGAPIFLLHGLLGSRDNWHSLAESWSAWSFCVAPDLANHGESYHVDTFDYGTMAEDVARLMDLLGLSEAWFVGHSMGGKVAMELALNKPSAVSGVIIEDMIPGKTTPRHLHYLEALSGIDLSQIGSRRDAEAMLAKAVPERMIRLFLLKNLSRTDDGEYVWRANLRGIADGYEHIWHGLAPGRSYEGPALFIRGGDSDTVPDSRIPEIRSFFPNSQIETIAGVAHWVHATKPEEFSQLTTRFLGHHGLDVPVHSR